MPTLSPERWRALSPHFETALNMPPADRKAWLDALRAEKPTLVRDLETLLADHRALEGEGFLEGSPVVPPMAATLAGQTLGAYTLIEPIGHGGMGSVWLAGRSDGRYEGRVAVKLLNASLVGRAGEERFRREGSILARLTHSNIARLLDAGVSTAGQPYLILEYVEGEPIDRYCDRNRLDVEERLNLYLDVLEAVAHAHAHRIVHRDIKPSNVLVGKDGRVKLLDFGIAKLLEEETRGGEATLTREGGRALTPEYAAPEQVAGGAVTTATDVYALGVLLYELLVGALPFDPNRLREAGWVERDRILREEEPLRPSNRISKLDAGAATVAERRKTDPATLRRVLGGDLDWMTLKALENDRTRRYGTAAEFAEDIRKHLRDEPVSAGPPDAIYRLRKLIRRQRVSFAAAAAFVVAVAGVLLLAPTRPGRDVSSGVKRLAVLPFENLGTSEDDYFADGISDAVRGKLTSLRGIQVIARDSSTPYMKTSKAPGQIAKELGVGYLLTATVRWQKGPGAAGRVEVRPELVEISSSGAPTSKWQQPFEAPLTDVFQVQSNIAARVAEGLGVALGAVEEKRLSEGPTQSLPAYDAFLKGEEASKAMGAVYPPALRKALGFYEEAVALDPDFAKAWGRVSQAHTFLYAFGTPSPEFASRALEAAERAVVLTPDRFEGYLALGDYEMFVARDVGRSLEHYAKGQGLAPGNADLLAARARPERSLGRWGAALEHYREAERLDPRSVMTLPGLGYVLFVLRRYPEAREAYDRGLALAPSNLETIGLKAMTFLGEGNLVGARKVLSAVPEEVTPTALVAHLATANDLGWVLDELQRELLLRLTPSAFDNDRTTWAICLLQAHALKGDRTNVKVYAEEARKGFEQQLHANPGDAQRRVFLGLALAYLGRKEEAMREGLRGAAALPPAKDADMGAYLQHQLAKIYILVGETEKALDNLELLLKIPYVLSPGWLTIDPNFDPLRRNPRFQRLVAGVR